MAHSERLVYASPCRRCGAEIEAGTPLEHLSWDPERRAWAHQNPRCEVRQPSPAPRAAGSRPEAPEGPPGPGEAGVPRVVAAGAGPEARTSDTPSRGAWSVTLELHEAADPALSKRVLRIARLRLDTLGEAREVAERLRRADWCRTLGGDRSLCGQRHASAPLS